MPQAAPGLSLSPFCCSLEESGSVIACELLGPGGKGCSENRMESPAPAPLPLPGPAP